jgi:hypothetical protein
MYVLDTRPCIIGLRVLLGVIEIFTIGDIDRNVPRLGYTVPMFSVFNGWGGAPSLAETIRYRHVTRQTSRVHVRVHLYYCL